MPERYTVSKNKDEIYHEHIKRYVFAKAFVGDKEVLDAACGSGYGSYFLANNGARHVSGIDVSEEAIRYCKRRYRYSNLNFKVMDATDLKFPDNSFDTVVSFETIEHINEPHLFLSELKRVLKPGGTLVISTPNKAVYGRLEGDAHAFHVKEFYLDEFKELLSGFFDIKNMYGQRISEYYDKRVSEHDRKIKKVSTINKTRSYLGDRLIKLLLPFPTVSSLKDMVISEKYVEESKFFIAVANPK